ncbi:ubiquitin conjugation factor E4 A [Hetaerina americana]|uniref:ubiquitin conjugation factor E4 A n=1 Tax=Hetaerina americana TaxID=62018 RepID=UPI003A7F22A7
MTDNIKNNPFTALFASVNQPEVFAPEMTDSGSASKSTIQGEHSKSPTEEVEPVEKELKERLEINQIVEDVFQLTLNKQPRPPMKGSLPSCHLVLLEELASALAPQNLIDIQTLEPALFERLMLTEPANHVLPINGRSSPVGGEHAVQRDVLIYLFECFRRLSERLDTDFGDVPKNSHQNIRAGRLSQMVTIVLQNASTALRQPDLFPGQRLDSQLLRLFAESHSPELRSFVNGIVVVFPKEEEGEADELQAAFVPVLNLAQNEISRGGLSALDRSVYDLLHVFALNDRLAPVLLACSTPANPNRGRDYANTILGAILSPSTIPESPEVPYAFFDQRTTLGQGSIRAEEEVAWTALGAVREGAARIFESLLRHPGEIRHRTLTWLASCLDANAPRGRIWNSLHGPGALGPGPAAHSCASDGFALNLCAVLLRLCQPFVHEHTHPRLMRIDPTYYAATLRSVNSGNSSAVDEERKKRGIHLNITGEETCLIPPLPSLSEGSSGAESRSGVARPQAENYTFLTECFFMTHKAIDLGFRVAHERLLRISQDLGRMRRVYHEVRAQSEMGGIGGSNPGEAEEAIVERVRIGTTEVLCLRTAMVQPQTLSLMAQMHVATSMWLVQVALCDIDGEAKKRTRDTGYAPGVCRDVFFPLPSGPPAAEDGAAIPPLLSCVPEQVVENVAGFLSFCRRFSRHTLEECGGSGGLDPLLTVILVFMGAPERIRNPHLRAGLAESLEALLPPSHRGAAEESPDEVSSIPGFNRERLFLEHPHRLQVVESLLHVFVGIEMTGQSVTFEQKFNYRRPMYFIMDYLWQIEEHKNSFKRLAAEVEANQESVSPPLFLRFVNLLMNDAVFLLDDALSNMAQLRQMQSARESGEWQDLPRSEREQNEGNFQRIGMIARFDNILGRETIHTLKFLTSEITSIFSHPTMVDRIASMLNYFLYHLVGPKKKNFKVKDLAEYEFKPASIVLDICQIYTHLGSSDAFCLAVSQDGRSYSPQLFSLAEDVLLRIGGGGLIVELQNVGARVAKCASQQRSQEELLSEAPDDFLDPIMSTLMLDPVVLPSSRTVVDRSTIARHLLSDQTDPFNRSPLTLDMVKPADELRCRIEAWIKERKREKNMEEDSRPGCSSKDDDGKMSTS